MQHEISRRDLMKSALATALLPALGVISKRSRAADLTPLDPNDPTAKALGFVTDASKVDAATNPTFKAGQHCAGCAQYQGTASDATAGCTIFAGHSVPGGGWCRAFVAKAG
jgi:hypothetical protein